MPLTEQQKREEAAKTVTALLEAEHAKQLLEADKFTAAQAEVLTGEYGVLQAITSITEELPAEVAAKAFRMTADPKTSKQAFNDFLATLPKTAATALENLYKLVRNEPITYEKDYDVTGMAAEEAARQHGIQPDENGHYIIPAKVTRGAIQNVLQSVTGEEQFNQNAAVIIPAVQQLTTNCLNQAADKLAPAPQNAVVPAAAAPAVQHKEAADNSWTQNAEDAAEPVLFVDFNHHEKPTYNYGSKEAQINADYLLALQMQMLEIALYMQERAQMQTLLMMVVTAQLMTRSLIDMVQFSVMVETSAVALIAQHGFLAEQNRDNQTCSHAAQEENSNNNMLNQTFRALTVSI